MKFPFFLILCYFNISIVFAQQSNSIQESSSPSAFKMITFTAIVDNGDIYLKWSKVDEVVIPSFYIERSTDGKKYKTAALIHSDGKNTQSNFTFKDSKVETENKLVFYRLHFKDEVGRDFYSDVRMVRLESASESMQLTSYPNPVQNELRLTFPADWQGKTIQLLLCSGNGAVLKTELIRNAGQTETINTSSLSRGIYMLRVQGNNRITQTIIIKS
jgi:hypothetical protein